MRFGPMELVLILAGLLGMLLIVGAVVGVIALGVRLGMRASCKDDRGE